MTRGPLDFVVLTFPGSAPGKEAVDALAGLRRADGIEVVDSLVVARGADGAVTSTELAESGLISPDEVGRTLDPGTCALAVLVEHTWAKDAAGGRLASIRFTAGHVPERPAAPVQATVRTATVADQLLQLGQMVQKGLLTQDEYAAAKTRLLAP